MRRTMNKRGMLGFLGLSSFLNPWVLIPLLLLVIVAILAVAWFFNSDAWQTLQELVSSYGIWVMVIALAIIFKEIVIDIFRYIFALLKLLLKKVGLG